MLSTVSQRAFFTSQHARFFLFDLNSQNGTFTLMLQLPLRDNAALNCCIGCLHVQVNHCAFLPSRVFLSEGLPFVRHLSKISLFPPLSYCVSYANIYGEFTHHHFFHHPAARQIRISVFSGFPDSSYRYSVTEPVMQHQFEKSSIILVGMSCAGPHFNSINMTYMSKFLKTNGRQSASHHAA